MTNLKMKVQKHVNEITKNKAQAIARIENRIKARDLQLHQEIIDATSFLDIKCGYTERVYCIINDISSPSLCPITKEKLLFDNYFKGYNAKRHSFRNMDLINIECDPLSDEDINFIKNNITEKDINHFNKLHTELYLKIMKHEGLGNAKMVERIYCIQNDIKERPNEVFDDFKNGYFPNSERKEIRDQKVLKYAELVGSTDLKVGFKIKKFIQRNKKNNVNLYDMSSDMEGNEYIICPLLGERLRLISKEYITETIGWTIEEFETKFPQFSPLPYYTSGTKEVRKAALQAVGKDGLTSHARGRAKAKIVNNTPDPTTGLTPNQKIGKSTKAAMSVVGEDGLTGYKRSARQRNITILENGLTVQQNAFLKRYEKENYNQSVSPASQLSKDALTPILQFLNENNIHYYFDKNEYAVTKDLKVYLYDLVIYSLKLCIEYQSNAYHPNPFWSEEKWTTWKQPLPANNNFTADEKYLFDINKAKLLWKERNILMWFVWQDSQENDVEVALEYIKELYKEQNENK